MISFQSICHAFGGNLVAIDTAEESDFLVAQISGYY